MDPLTLLLETAALSAAICAMHALKPRLGLGPLYAALTLFAVFLFVAGQGEPPLMAQYFLAPPGRLGSMLFTPLVLVTLALVYDLEGSEEARRMFAALTCLYALHGGVEVVLEWHANHPPTGQPHLNHVQRFFFDPWDRGASLLSLLIDAVVIIVVYQGLSNIAPNLPRPLTLATGLVLATFADAIGYLTFTGAIFDRPPSWDLIEKAQTGLAAATPMALYMSWFRHRWPQRVRRDRSTLEILDLRQQLEDSQKRLAKEQEQALWLKQSFSRYVSPEVADLIAADPERLSLGGESREVTILFADIRGYSTLAEQMTPEEVIDMLNQYFGVASDAILTQGGMINEFEGDAVLAVFGAPLPLEGHAHHALQAALGMLSAVERLNTEWADSPLGLKWRQAGFDGLAIRVGLHSGPVIAGNVGSAARMKYAVIGDTVNVASRVEGLNKSLGTSLLISAATQRALDGRAPRLRSLGTHHVKGRAEAVEVFTLSDTD